MAKNAISDWDETAANNTDVSGVSIAENCPAANVNNAMREIMAQVATWTGDMLSASVYAAYGGSANVVTLTTDVTLTAYATGMEFRFRATAANTGATTINVDGLGAKNAETPTGAALPSGYIRTDVDTVVRYDGTKMVVFRAPEYGSGANGEWVRLENGVQQCWDSVTSNSAMTFAAAFSATPITTITPTGSNARMVSVSGNSSTGCTPWAYNSAGTATPTATFVHSVGTWF